MIPPPISPLSDYTEKRVPGGTLEHESWELYTQSAGPGKEGDVDEDLADIRESHHRQIKHYKTLLIRAQSASAASIHELHTKLTDLKGRYDKLERDHSACRSAKAETTRHGEMNQGRLDMSNVKGMMRNATKDERLEILSAVLEGCLPSDISTQIAILQKYRRSRFDILGSLPEALAAEVMQNLDLSDILSLRRLVSKGYFDLSRNPGVWRYRCIQLDGPTHPVTHVRKITQNDGELDRDWEDRYRQLHLREINWTSGTSTGVSVVPAHTNYITSLCLHEDILISGSYDESIRIWHLPPMQPSEPARLTLMHTIPAKAVSCLAYYPATKTLVAGYHDNGRIQIWRKIGQEWISHYVVHGHSHGIRAVAIHAKWAVSAGADKTIVIWDWRTGEKYLKFGQQTNICVGLHLVYDTVISMTIDGIIRAFSIARREMTAKYKLWDLGKEQEGVIARAEGTITWFDANNLNMTCGTKDGIHQLCWQPCITPALSEDAPATPATSLRKTLLTVVRKPAIHSSAKESVVHTLAIVSPLQTRTTLPASLATPTRSKTVPIPPPSTTSSKASSSLTPMRIMPRRSMTASMSASTPTRAPLIPGSKPASSMMDSPNVRSVSISRVDCTVGAEEPGPVHELIVPNVKVAPIFTGTIAVKGVGKGALGPNGRFVASTRFAARQGAKREIYVGSGGPTEQVAIARMRGAWSEDNQHEGLRTPEKNPLSIVMDREKIVYGCADGSIVVVGFL